MYNNYLPKHSQGLDIHWRDHYICPTVEEYIDMVLKKTGGLMMLAFDLMFIFRNQSGQSAVWQSDEVLSAVMWQRVNENKFYAWFKDLVALIQTRD